MQCVRQLVFPGFHVGKEDPASAEELTDLGVGGFCLYGGAVRDVAALTRRLQRRARVPLLFCADYEDGLASHVRGGTALPSNMGLGAAGRPELAFEKGRITAVEARALGVRWVFAPVVDLATRAENPIVNVRSFGRDPGRVSRLAAAYLRGLRGERVLGSLKHFPGHGETREDSHLELPALDVPMARLFPRELRPYRDNLAAAGSVMVGHLAVRAAGDDRGTPASLSRKVTGGWLRGRLGYRGLVVTDALMMRAVSERFPELKACLGALGAGADVLLVPDDPRALLARLPAALEAAGLGGQARAAFARLLRAKQSCGLFDDGGLDPEGELSLVGCARHRAAADRLAEAVLTRVGSGGIRLPRTVSYMEPGTRRGDWKGKPLLKALRELGVRIADRGEAALAGVFVGPRAYSGRIRLSAVELGDLERVLRGPGPAVVVSFGSPFVFGQLRGRPAGLCAFSPSEPLQRAAARVLVGAARARGRMPVDL